MNLRRFIRPSAVVLATSLTLTTLTGFASASVLYQENFDDATLNGDSGLRQGSVAGGIVDFNDTNTGNKANFWLRQEFTADVMTFSFDVRAPITQPDTVGTVDDPGQAENDLLLRVSVGTGGDISSSADAIMEQILFRDGNRTGYKNNGNESAFLVSNISANPINFTSPVDGATTVTLNALQYAVYVRDNTDSTFLQAKGPTTLTDRNGATAGVGIQRIGIGNSSSGNLGTFSIDNVGVVDEVSFVSAVPEPSALALLGVGGLLALRRRRSA